MHEGEAPPLVLWAMSEEIRALALIAAGIDPASRWTSCSRERESLGAAAGPGEKGRCPAVDRNARSGVAHAGKIDRLAKGLGQGDIWEEFLRLGLSLGQAKDSYFAVIAASGSRSSHMQSHSLRDVGDAVLVHRLRQTLALAIHRPPRPASSRYPRWRSPSQ
jgi:hypothetical protein